MNRAGSGEKRAIRQCWECLKRRLVCDHTLPHCEKCIKAGRECSGYDEQKPLQWVEPGMVTSRRRKKDSPPKVYATKPRESKLVALAISHKGSDKSDLADTVTLGNGPTLKPPLFEEPRITAEAIEIYKSQLASLLVHEEKAAWWHSLTAEEQTKHIALMVSEAAAGSWAASRIVQIGSQRKLKAVVERGQHWEAALLLQSDRDPLARLKRMLWVMETNQLPSYDFLSNETCEVVQAVSYCMLDSSLCKLLLTYGVNTRIYPDAKETDSLAPNPAVIHFPMWALHVLPPAMHHTLVCLGLNHFIHSLPAGSSRAIIANNRSKIYEYRGRAIRALSEYVAKEKTRSSDMTISSILMFMAMEVSSLSI